MDGDPRPLPETFHVLGADDRCDWCGERWPCEFEREANYYRRLAAQVCQCGHERQRHHRNSLGFDQCAAVDFTVGPPWKSCGCRQFRRAVTRP
jgi:hypothetical protein